MMFIAMDPNLRSLLLKKAEEELRETDLRRTQSLKQFREWLCKHPFLKRTRQDDKYLILFLRYKKYSLSEVFKSYEKHFLFRIKCSNWYTIDNDETVARLRSHIECGSKYAIVDNSSLEPVTIIQRFGKFDVNRYSFSDFFYSDFQLVLACNEIEKFQICGMRLLIDFTNFPISVIASISVKDLMNWSKSLNSSPIRLKQVIIVNVPSMVIHLVNIAIMFLSEKLKSRVVVIKTYEEIKNFMDTSIFPEYLGGCCDEQTYINESLKIFDENLMFLKATNDYEIDLTQVNGRYDNEEFGSFRKLEID